jgi:hypothetical protein
LRNITEITWAYSIEDHHNGLHYLSSLKTYIIFTTELAVIGHLPFLDVLVMTKEGSLTTTVYRKPTRRGRYKSSHPEHVKRGVIQGLVYSANVLCHN